MVGYHIWSVGQPEKPTEKLNTMFSKTLFSGFVLVGRRNSSIADRVRSWICGLFFCPLGLCDGRGLTSVALAEPGALSNAPAGRALEECSRGTV